MDPYIQQGSRGLVPSFLFKNDLYRDNIKNRIKTDIRLQDACAVLSETGGF